MFPCNQKNLKLFLVTILFWISSRRFLHQSVKFYASTEYCLQGIGTKQLPCLSRYVMVIILMLETRKTTYLSVYCHVVRGNMQAVGKYICHCHLVYSKSVSYTHLDVYKRQVLAVFVLFYGCIYGHFTIYCLLLIYHLSF